MLDLETLKAQLKECESQIHRYQSLRTKIEEMIRILEGEHTSPSLESSSANRRHADIRQKLINFFVDRNNEPAKQLEIIKKLELEYSNLAYHVKKDSAETFETHGEGKERTFCLTNEFFQQEMAKRR